MTEDPMRLIILARGLQAAADEMATNLIRSAFSAVVREARDCSTALLDARGRVVAQAELIPMQTAALSESFRCAREQLDLAGIGPDHAIIMNDPYSGGQHLNDIILFTPIFHHGELLGWSGSTAHHLDIGGGSPGVNSAATELLQEGLIIPPLLIDVTRDWHGGMIERLIFANIRTAEIGLGDMNAQFAANHIGRQRILEMARRHGADVVAAAMAATLDYSERRMRAGIADLPDGTWSGEAFLDGDGVNGRPVRVVATVTIRGEEAILDFSGTDPQVKGMFNCPLASSMAGALTALRSVLADKDMPANDGCNRPVVMIFPEGSILNPRRGAPVRARASAACRALDAVHAAFDQVIPDRVPAQGANTTTSFNLTRAGEDGRTHLHLDIIGGGWGGAKGYDAVHATDHILSSCRLTPVESIEQLTPYLLMESFGLVTDSGGAGEFNGGMGLLRRVIVRDTDVALSIYSDRFGLPARGLQDGHDGARAHLRVFRNGDRTELDATSRVALQPGDLVEIATAGGGGWGDPKRRSRDAVAGDVADGLVTPAFAAREYGWQGPAAADKPGRDDAGQTPVVITAE
jgi:N-methylhydantoinase B